MFRKFLIAATLSTALSTGALTSMAMAEPLTISHSQGETTLPAAPQKVLILDVNALDIADALGAEPAGVVGSNLPAWLKKYEADSYAKLGTLFEPDYEAIAAEGGDLMIVGTRSAKTYPEMSKLLPTVDLSLDATDQLGSVKANIGKVGQIFGKEAEAAELVKVLDGKIDHLKEVAPGAGTALILVTNGGKLGAYGPTSRIGWIHTALGFAPVEEGIDDRFHGGDVISFEYILEKNPDWIFVVDRDAGVGEAGAGAQATLDNALMKETTAVKEGKIVFLDPEAAYIAFGGYTAVSMLIDELTDALAAKN